MKRKRCAEQKNVSSIQRLGRSDTLHTTAAHFPCHPQEKHSLCCQSKLGGHSLATFSPAKWFYSFWLLSVIDLSVFWPFLFFFFSSSKGIGWAGLNLQFTQRKGVMCDHLNPYLTKPGKTWKPWITRSINKLDCNKKLYGAQGSSQIQQRCTSSAFIPFLLLEMFCP